MAVPMHGTRSSEATNGPTLGHLRVASSNSQFTNHQQSGFAGMKVREEFQVWGLQKSSDF